MGDIYLSHSRKGSMKKNHKYVSRKMVNGKWVYEYKNIGGWGDETTDPQDTYKSVSAEKRYQKSVKQDRDFYSRMANRQRKGLLVTEEAKGTDWEKLRKNANNRIKSSKDREKRYKKSADTMTYNIKNEDRAKHNSKSHQLKLKYGAYKNKVGRNILKGKKKVAELLDRLQKKYKSGKKRK